MRDLVIRLNETEGWRAEVAKDVLEMIPKKPADPDGAKVSRVGEAWAGAQGPAAGSRALLMLWLWTGVLHFLLLSTNAPDHSTLGIP